MSDELREVNVNGVRFLRADDVERWHRGMVARAEEWDDLSERVEAVEAQLAEAERVLKVISGWNPDRVDVATAIQPAIAYLAAMVRDTGKRPFTTPRDRRCFAIIPTGDGRKRRCKSWRWGSRDLCFIHAYGEARGKQVTRSASAPAR